MSSFVTSLSAMVAYEEEGRENSTLSAVSLSSIVGTSLVHEELYTII